MSLDRSAMRLIQFLEITGLTQEYFKEVEDFMTQPDINFDEFDSLESNIELIEFYDDEEEMCDITVEDVHCYYANGILTHNCAQELRCISNYTNCHLWVDTFLTGGDLHKNMTNVS